MEIKEETKKTFLNEHLKLAIWGFWGVTGTSIVATLYFARDYFLALLLSDPLKFSAIILSILLFCLVATIGVLWRVSSSRVRKLRDQIEGLESANSSKGVSENATEAFSPNAIETAMLKFLFGCTEDQTEAQIYQAVGIQEYQFGVFHLARLRENDFVRGPLKTIKRPGSVNGYTLKQKGREFVISNELYGSEIRLLDANRDHVVPLDGVVDEYPLGMLDFLEMTETAIDKFSELLEELNNQTQQVTKRTGGHTDSITQIAQDGNPAKGSRINKIALLAASDINTFSRNVEALLPQFGGSVAQLEKSHSGYFQHANHTPEDDETYRQQIINLDATVTETLEQVKGWIAAVVSLRSMNLSREFTRASSRQEKTLQGIVDILNSTRAFCKKMLELLRNNRNKQNDS